MKKLLSIIVILAMLCVPVSATEVMLYNADGEKIVIDSSEEAEMRSKGWQDFSQVYTVVYSADGRKMDVLKSKLAEWKAVGWYDNIADVQTELYSQDGRSITVWNTEVEAYLQVGWYRSLDEVQTTLYSQDGRSIAVWNAEVEAYLQVGWYRTLNEVQTTLYSQDGRNIAVWNAEIDAYLQVGWYRTLAEVQTVIYSRNGDEKTVWNAELSEYLENGWSTEKNRIDSGKPMVAITFDDGPGPYTDKILDCLEKYNAKATFFVVGNRLGNYSKQLKREAELGMEIGCHTWSHPQLTKLGSSTISNEIFNTNNKVKEITGVYPTILRPPYGSYNDTVKSVAKCPIIMWSVDTLDWKTKNANSTYNAVMNNVKDGDIILMHDIHSATADAAVRLIPALIDAGYQLVTVSELGEYKKGGLVASQVYTRIK